MRWLRNIQILILVALMAACSLLDDELRDGSLRCTMIAKSSVTVHVVSDPDLHGDCDAYSILANRSGEHVQVEDDFFEQNNFLDTDGKCHYRAIAGWEVTGLISVQLYKNGGLVEERSVHVPSDGCHPIGQKMDFDFSTN